MTVDELIDRLRVFRGHETVKVLVEQSDAVALVASNGLVDTHFDVCLVEPDNSQYTGTAAVIVLE